MKFREFIEHPWVKKGGLLTGVALAASLSLCDSKKDTPVPRASSEVQKNTAVDDAQEDSRSKARHSTQPVEPLKEVTDPFAVHLPETIDGIIDLQQTNLLSALESCIEGPGDTICTNSDSNLSKCITLREEGAIPIWITDPFNSASAVLEGDTLNEERELRIDVGGSEFYFPLNMSNSSQTNESLGDACKVARQWLSTSWEDLDREIICNGIEANDPRCDEYLDYLTDKGSNGYIMKKKMDDLGEILDHEGIQFFQSTPYSADMPLLNSEGEIIGTLSIIIGNNNGLIAYKVHSTVTGTDFNEPLPETAEGALTKIQREIAAAAQY